MRYFLEFDTSRLPEEEASVVVCGSGIGGLTTAIVLKELGEEPVILTRGVGNTYYSQGGIAAAVHPHDSTHSHLMDTLRAGRYLNDPEAVKILVEEGVLRIADLERWGVRFDRKEDYYDTTSEGGHSFRRVLKVKDFTGKEIYTKLLKRVKELGIPILKGELQEIVGEEKAEGILYTSGGSLRFLRTKAVVLATGGAASMFLYTSNPSKVRGDGIGIAVRAGVPLRNPEFVQFHPTVLEGTNVLISEAVRGEGAVLVDSEGNRFVDELQPRDVVARAVYEKLKEGKRVFLDMRPLLSKGIDLGDRFPTIAGFLKERGIDPYKDPVPVVPAAHYYIGGLLVDTFGRTPIPGLYAVGECACTGVHGANRLASNSLLEGVVFGYRTAYRVHHDLLYFKGSKSNFSSKQKGQGRHGVRFTDLKALMWEKAGLVRSGEELSKAENILMDWIGKVKKAERTPENRRLLDILLVALLTVKGALMRKESRGVHYRSDYPNEREGFRRDTLIVLNPLLE